MTPLQVELHQAHKARQARMAEAAARHAWNAKARADCRPAPKVIVVPTQEAGEAAITIAEPSDCPRIQRIVAKRFGVTRADLVGASQCAKVAIPRQVAMYLVHDMTKQSLRWVGWQFGGRDHTTVLHAVRKIERWVEQDLFDMPATLAVLRAELVR